MDGVGGVGGPAAGGAAQTETASQGSGPSAEEQAAFDQAIKDFATAEILTDYFVVEQPMIAEINKEASK